MSRRLLNAAFISQEKVVEKIVYVEKEPEIAPSVHKSRWDAVKLDLRNQVLCYYYLSKRAPPTLPLVCQSPVAP